MSKSQTGSLPAKTIQSFLAESGSCTGRSTGIAARYPGGRGIENDPDVVFAESFEGPVDENCSRWEAAIGKPIMSKSEEVVSASLAFLLFRSFDTDGCVRLLLTDERFKGTAL